MICRHCGLDIVIRNNRWFARSSAFSGFYCPGCGDGHLPYVSLFEILMDLSMAIGGEAQ